MTTLKGSRTTIVKDAGRVYEIPEIWLIGFQTGARARNEPCTLRDAIAAWIWQAELAEQDVLA